jgi:hypothetical protein
MNIRISLYEDFDVFARALIASNDCDPVYPFIRSTLKHFSFEPEWFCFAYTTFYSLESAMKFCKNFPERKDYNMGRFFDLRQRGVISKMGYERRGNQRTMVNQNTMFQSFNIAIDTEALKWNTNQCFRQSLRENIPFHGAWATFKVAEVFEKVLLIKTLKVLDLGLDGRDPNSNDGPCGGITWLYGKDNEYDKTIFPHWNRFGENLAKGWGVDIGECETALCKFNKLVSGKYYVGHDIDEHNELKNEWGKNTFLKIMSENFDERFWKGVHGVRKEFKTRYKNCNVIINDDFAGKYRKLDVLQTILNTD